MPAHLRPLPKCRSFGCNRPATEMLYNARNAPMGEYCASHAKGALKTFQRDHERPTP